MMIISKHKDYYDTIIQQTGIDKTHVFERHTRLEKLNLQSVLKFGDVYRNLLHIYNDKYSQNLFNVKPFLLAFCGKTYIYWKITNNDTLEDTYIWKKEKLIDFVFHKYKKEFFQLYGFKELEKTVHDFYEDYDKKEFKKIFTEYRIAYFNIPFKHSRFTSYHGFEVISDEIEIYPNLKDIEFYKVFDPFSAFQEIEMFLFGVLGNPEKNQIEVTEKNRISQRGFDKWSFRQTAPGQKKEKRRLNKIKKRNRKK